MVPNAVIRMPLCIRIFALFHTQDNAFRMYEGQDHGMNAPKMCFDLATVPRQVSALPKPPK